MTHTPTWRQVLYRFLPMLRRHSRALVRAYTLGLLAVSAAVLAPWLLKFIIDNVLIGKPLPPWLAGLRPDWPATAMVTVLVAVSALLAALGAYCSAGEKVRNARIREQFGLEVRDRLLSHIQTLPVALHGRQSSGELVLRLVDDVHHLVRLLTKTAPVIFRHLVTALLAFAAMFWLSPPLGLLGIILVGLLALLVHRYASPLKRASRHKRQREGEVAGLAQEIIRALPNIQAEGIEQAVRLRFAEQNRQSLGAGVAETRIAVNMKQTMQIANGLAVALIIGGGGFLVLQEQLTLGGLTVCMAYIAQLLKPVEKINELASAVVRGLARGERLLALREQEPVLRDRPDAVALKHPQGRIELQQVSFAYPPSLYQAQPRMVLDKVDLVLEPDSLAVLVGPSGSGKNTLLGLLLRLFEPSAGRLRDLLHTPGEEISDSRLWSALAQIAMDEFVQNLPHKLDARLDEDAVNLSGGQRARLALARTLLLDRPFLPESDWCALERAAGDQPGLTLKRTVPGLTSWLQTSKVSVSQCGYKTAMELLQSRVKALVVPFAEGNENEQMNRARRLQRAGALKVLHPDRLGPQTLCDAIAELLHVDQQPTGLNMQGAEASLDVIKALLERQPCHREAVR